MWKKGRLRKSDYFLIFALPCIFAGVALLQTSLDTLYAFESRLALGEEGRADPRGSTAARLASAIELLWIGIYSVKASFLAQFKFYKPPFAYVSVLLTRLYWVIVAVCGLGFLFTLTVPIVLCPSSCKSNGRY